jgi:hypothetical protein
MSSFVEQPLGRCPFGRLKYRWKGNIKIEVKEECFEEGKRMELVCVQYRTLVLAVFKC